MARAYGFHRMSGEALAEGFRPADFEAAIGRSQRSDIDPLGHEMGHPRGVRTQAAPAPAAHGEDGGADPDAAFPGWRGEA